MGLSSHQASQIRRAQKDGSPDSHRKRRLFPRLDRTEILFLVLCLCVYLSWTLVFTTWSYGPDEYMRYDIPKYIYANHALPTGPEESIRNPIWGVSYGFDIGMPYLLGALFMSATSLFSTDGTLLMLSARLVSVLSTVGAAYFAMLLARKMIGKKPIRWVFVISVSLLPQVVFLSSYFNLDTFSLFAVLMIVYAWTACLEREWDTASSIFVAVAMGLCFLSYQFAYSYILATFLLYVFWHLMYRKKRSFKRFITTGLVILAVVLVISGWKFIRNGILYDGDFLSLNASKPYAEMYAMEEYKPSVRVSLAQSGVGLRTMFFDMQWLSMTFQSLIGVFGYLNIFMPKAFYEAFKYVFAFCAAGTLLKMLVGFMGARRSGTLKDAVLIELALILGSFVTFCISVYNSYTGDYQAQGRYIIAVLPLLAMVTASGAEFWIELVTRRIARRPALTPRAERRFAWLFLGAMLLSTFTGFYLCLSTFVYASA